MKLILLKTLLIINLFFIYNCKAQTTTDYIAFYNDLALKLNSMVPNKTQYYNQNFSNFYNDLQSKNIDIIFQNYDPKVIPGTKYYVLNLIFTEIRMMRISIDNHYQLPFISITFKDEISPQIDQLSIQSHGRWSYDIAQFFANMKIEKIEFVGVNGYDNQDRTIK